MAGLHRFVTGLRFPAHPPEFSPAGEHPVRVAGALGLYVREHYVQCGSEPKQPAQPGFPCHPADYAHGIG